MTLQKRPHPGFFSVENFFSRPTSEGMANSSKETICAWQSEKDGWKKDVLPLGCPGTEVSESMVI